MSWDLIHVRLIEKHFTVRPIDSVKFAIHTLLTYDNGLKEILEINPIEQIAFYKDIPIPKLKEYWVDNIPGAKEKLYLKENMVSRYQAFSELNIENLTRELEMELIYLCGNGQV